MSEENLTVEGLRGQLNAVTLDTRVKAEFFNRLRKLENRERAGVNVQAELRQFESDLRQYMPEVVRGSLRVTPASRATPRASSFATTAESKFIADMAAIYTLLQRSGFLEEGAKASRRRPVTVKQFDLLVKTYDNPEYAAQTQNQTLIEKISEATMHLYKYIETYLNAQERVEPEYSAVRNAFYTLDTAVRAYNDVLEQRIASERRSIGAPQVRIAPSSRAIIQEESESAAAAERKRERELRAPDPFAGQARPLMSRTSQPGAKRQYRESRLRQGEKARIRPRPELWHIAKMPSNDPKRPYYGCVLVSTFPYGMADSLRALAAKKHSSFPLKPLDGEAVDQLMAEEVKLHGARLRSNVFIPAKPSKYEITQKRAQRREARRTKAVQYEPSNVPPLSEEELARARLEHTAKRAQAEEEARKLAAEVAAQKTERQRRGAEKHEARFAESIHDIPRGWRDPMAGPLPQEVPPSISFEDDGGMAALPESERDGSPLPRWFRNARVKDMEFLEDEELELANTLNSFGSGAQSPWLVMATLLRYSLHYPMDLSAASKTIFARRRELVEMMKKYTEMNVTFDANVSGHFIIDFRGLFSGGKAEDQELYATNATELIKSFFYVYGAQSSGSTGIVTLRQALGVEKKSQLQRMAKQALDEAAEAVVVEYYSILPYEFGGVAAVLQLTVDHGKFVLRDAASRDPSARTAESVFQDTLSNVAADYQLEAQRDALEKQARARIQRELPAAQQHAADAAQKLYAQRAEARMAALAREFVQKLLSSPEYASDLTKAVVIVDANDKNKRRVGRLQPVALKMLQDFCRETYAMPAYSAFQLFKKYAPTGDKKTAPKDYYTDAMTAVRSALTAYLFPRENADESAEDGQAPAEEAVEGVAESTEEVTAWPTEQYDLQAMPSSVVTHAAEPFIIDWLNKDHSFVGVYVDTTVEPPDPEDPDAAFHTFGPHNVVTVAQYYRQYKDSFYDPAKFTQTEFFADIDEVLEDADEDDEDDDEQPARRQRKRRKSQTPRLCIVRIVYDENTLIEDATILGAYLDAEDEQNSYISTEDVFKIQFIWPFASEPLFLSDVSDDEEVFGSWMSAFAARQVDPDAELDDNMITFVQDELAQRYLRVRDDEAVAVQRTEFAASMFDMYRAVRWIRWVRNINIQAEIDNAIERNNKAIEAGRDPVAVPVIVSEQEREAVLAFLADEIKKASLRLARSGSAFDFMHVTTIRPYGRGVRGGGAYVVKKATPSAETGGKTRLEPGFTPDLDELDAAQYKVLGLPDELITATRAMTQPAEMLVAPQPAPRQIAAKVRYKAMETTEESSVEREAAAPVGYRFGPVWRAVRERWRELAPEVNAYWKEGNAYVFAEQSADTAERRAALDDPERFEPSAHWELDPRGFEALRSGAIKVSAGEPRVVVAAKGYAMALIELKSATDPAVAAIKKAQFGRVVASMASSNFLALQLFNKELIELMQQEVEPYLDRIYGPDEQDAVAALDEFWQKAQAAGPRALYYFAPLMVFYGKTAGTASVGKSGENTGAITGNPALLNDDGGDIGADDGEEEAIPPEVMEQIRENLGWPRRRSNRSTSYRPLTPAQTERVNSLREGPAFIVREAVVREMATGKYTLRVAFQRAVDKLVKRGYVDTATGTVLLTPAGQTAEATLAKQMVRSKGRLREVLGYYDGYVRREQRKADLTRNFVNSIRKAARNKPSPDTLRDNPPGYALSGEVLQRRMFDPRSGQEVMTPVVEYRPQVFEAPPSFSAGKQQGQGRVPGTRGWRKGTTRYETKPYRPRIYLPIDPDHPTTQAFFEEYSLKTHERIRDVLDWHTKTHKASAPDVATYTPDELIPMGRQWRGQGQRGKVARRMKVTTQQQMDAAARKLAQDMQKAQRLADKEAGKVRKSQEKQAEREQKAREALEARNAKRTETAARRQPKRKEPAAPSVSSMPPQPAPVVRVPVASRAVSALEQLKDELRKLGAAYRAALAANKQEDAARLDAEILALSELIDQQQRQERKAKKSASTPSVAPVASAPVEAAPEALPATRAAGTGVQARRRTTAPSPSAPSVVDLDLYPFNAATDTKGRVKHPLDIDISAALSFLDTTGYDPDDADIQRYAEFVRGAYEHLGVNVKSAVGERQRNLVVEYLRTQPRSVAVFDTLVEDKFISAETAERLAAGVAPDRLIPLLIKLLPAPSVKTRAPRDNVSTRMKGSNHGARIQRFRVQ